MADLEKLDKTIKELEEQANGLKDFTKVYSEIGSLKQEINTQLSLIKQSNNGLDSISNKIKIHLESSEKQLDKIEEGLFKKIQELYNDGKSFQKELDSSITSRLEKHRSDIQVEVRNEAMQIQRSFENALQSSFNAMETKIGSHFSKHSEQLNLLKILAFVTIGIVLGLCIGLYLK
jgi:multidrug efflux pump subunit AcrB